MNGQEPIAANLHGEAICPGCKRPVSECQADDVDESSFPAVPAAATPSPSDFDRRVLIESFKQAADEADSRLAKMNDAAMLVLRVRLRLDALDGRESDGKPLMRFPSERRLLDEALELLTDA